MGIFSAIADLISFVIKILIPKSSSFTESYAAFIARQELFENFPWQQCFIRNEELNNSLKMDDCHPIFIEEITRETLKLSWVPDIPELFSPAEHLQKWALLVVDLPAQPADPGTKDFDYEKIVLIIGGNKAHKTLNYKAHPPELLEDIAKWKGCRVVLYNPFINCEFKPAPIITLPPLDQRPEWCRTYLSPAAMFQRSDGKFILLVNGESRQSKQEHPQQKVGAFITNDPWYDTFKPLNSSEINSMAPIFTGSAAYHSGDSFQITSIIKSRQDGYWMGYGNGRIGDKWSVVAVKFDEYFRDIQYFKQIIIPAAPNCKTGEYFPTVIQYDNQYRMMWVNRIDDSPTTWFLSEGISDDELGPFDPGSLSSNPVLTSINWHNGSFRSNHTHCPSYFIWEDELYCIIDGTSRWKTSGNRANRLFGIIKYDKIRQIWLEDLRNPLFINPMYGDQLWNESWAWCADHLGGKQFFWRNQDGALLFFFSASHGFDNYKVGLAKIKQFIA